ncbi:hypothetical protein VT25_04715 [Photobacterium leiognathi subsp. mandapamensis]|nr:hypothetical protein VT25_04715 [Photobacterium leiognathi subsp. mandapamensis]PSV22819.1 hypothetical protein C0W44_05655 [Photobacterium leiognathi subsp. mandapamensis]
MTFFRYALVNLVINVAKAKLAIIIIMIVYVVSQHVLVELGPVMGNSSDCFSGFWRFCEI